MLRELRVRNLALLVDTRVVLADGLVALTGPTGAGKSLVLRALTLLLGARFSREFLRTGTTELELEGLFTLDPTRAATVAGLVVGTEAASADEASADEWRELVLTRRIDDGGRNRCTANGHLVTVGALRDVGAVLCEVHGQSEHHALQDPAEQVRLLDRSADLEPEWETYRDAWQAYRRATEQLRRLRSGRREREGRIADLRETIEELETAELRPGELEELRRERTLLAEAERHQSALAEALAALEGERSEGESGALDATGRAARLLAATAELSGPVAEAVQALDGALTLLDDALASIRSAADDLEADPRRLDEVNDRVALLESLLRRHGPEESDALEELTAARTELAELLELGEDASGAERVVGQRADELLAAGRRLNDLRRAAAESFCARVTASLADLGMPGTRFGVEQTGGESVEDATELGLGELGFVVSPNVGEDLKSLAKIASGGELARISLAMKGELAGRDDVPLLVFDEVDADVGPRMGEVIGRRLATLARGRQVLAVTHLPQVAAYADVHLCVKKEATDGRTIADVAPLSGIRRVGEIAEMLHGARRREAGRDAAEELLATADAWRAETGEQSSGANADGERDVD